MKGGLYVHSICGNKNAEYDHISASDHSMDRHANSNTLELLTKKESFIYGFHATEPSTQAHICLREAIISDHDASESVRTTTENCGA
jgi:hypothetical protein